MKNKDKILKVLVVVLSLLVVGLVSFVIYSKVLGEQDNSGTNNDKIIQNNENASNCVNNDIAIDADELYNIAKSDYNFVKRQYYNNQSYSLTADGRVNISFNNYITNISNAKDILLYHSQVSSMLYILTEEGNLYKYDINNNSNNYTATKVDEYSNIVKMIDYQTIKANAGGCMHFVIVDNDGNYYKLDSQCV